MDVSLLQAPKKTISETEIQEFQGLEEVYEIEELQGFEEVYGMPPGIT